MLGAMAGNPRERGQPVAFASHEGVERPRDRAHPHGHARAELTAPFAPPELAFLAAEGFPPEPLLYALSAAPRGVRPVDCLLNEGKLTEEAYYRSLASHLGCQYYCGDPPLASAFDAVKGLRCGVAPLEPRSAGPRFVVEFGELEAVSSDSPWLIFRP